MPNKWPYLRQLQSAAASHGCYWSARPCRKPACFHWKFGSRTVKSPLDCWDDYINCVQQCYAAPIHAFGRNCFGLAHFLQDQMQHFRHDVVSIGGFVVFDLVDFCCYFSLRWWSAHLQVFCPLKHFSICCSSIGRSDRVVGCFAPCQYHNVSRRVWQFAAWFAAAASVRLFEQYISPRAPSRYTLSSLSAFALLLHLLASGFSQFAYVPRIYFLQILCFIVKSKCSNLALCRFSAVKSISGGEMNFK